MARVREEDRPSIPRGKRGVPPGRISLFLPSLDGGGAEKSFVNLANALVKRGVGVDLILLERRGPFLGSLDPRVMVVGLGTHSALRGLPALLGYIRRKRPSVLVSALEGPNLAAGLARWIHPRFRLVATVHNLDQSLIAGYGPAKRLLYRLFYGPLLRRADRVVAVSEGIRKECVVGHFGVRQDRSLVIPNLVLDDAFRRRVAAPTPEAWFREVGRPFILSAGRLEPQKDFSLLLKAFSAVRLKKPHHLLILGEGSERAHLKELADSLGIGDRVHLPGFVADPQRFMRQAALFVLSSRHEGFAVVLVEAMACGTPVVSTDCPFGPSELLQGGRYGKLAPVGNAPALAGAILTSLDKGPPTGARVRARDFRAQTVVGRYLRLFMNLEGKGAFPGTAERENPNG